MNRTSINKLFSDLKDAAAAAQRFYKLDDQYMVHVELDIRRFDRSQLTAHVVVYEKCPSLDDEEPFYDCVDLDCLSVRALVRVADIKMHVERWNIGEAEELPASTAENFIEAEEKRREARRARRMYRR